MAWQGIVKICVTSHYGVYQIISVSMTTAAISESAVVCLGLHKTTVSKQATPAASSKHKDLTIVPVS